MRAAPRRSATATTRLLAAAGLVALIGGLLFIVTGETGDDSGTIATVVTTTSSTPPPPVRKPPVQTRIAVTGIGAYDPQGDQSENGGDARLATDGNPTTAWKSEHYRTTFSKAGVGLVLDAGRPVKAARVTVTTDTPGYAAQVQVGASPTGPFTSVSASKTTTPRTVYVLKPRTGRRYLVIWITSMPAGGVAAVNEVRVTAGG